MPRRIFTLVSKTPTEKSTTLNALCYEQALEEALALLGWEITEDCDEPYKSIRYSETYSDEHMVSMMQLQTTKSATQS
jgi:hypothetical protein